jgi:hypothetical protein
MSVRALAAHRRAGRDAGHEGFWTNLLAYGEKIGAEVLVGGFTYNKSLFEDHASRTAVFASAVQPYLIHDNRMLGPLLFAAKMNILPTAVRPLSGLTNYGRGAWTVFPHAKVQLDSVPSLPGKHPGDGDDDRRLHGAELHREEGRPQSRVPSPDRRDHRRGRRRRPNLLPPDRRDERRQLPGSRRGRAQRRGHVRQPRRGDHLGRHPPRADRPAGGAHLLGFRRRQ